MTKRKSKVRADEAVNEGHAVSVQNGLNGDANKANGLKNAIKALATGDGPTLGEKVEKLKKAKAISEEDKTPATSMAVLLTQGLMANDAVKIDTVLKETRTEVIRNTLNDLPVGNIIPLLKCIEDRLRTRQAIEIRPWIRWLQIIMATHVSFLSTHTTLEAELGGLMEWMKARALHQQKLVMLQGKMNVIAEQVERRSNRTLCIDQQPLIVFNNDDEVDSDLDDMESLGSEQSRGSSEEDWWDEGELVEGDEDNEDEESEEGDSDDDIPVRKQKKLQEKSPSDEDDEEEEEVDEEMEDVVEDE